MDLLLRIDYVCPVVGAFIPIDFFAEIFDLMKRTGFQSTAEILEKQLKFLDDFDAESFENVFVKWNKHLKAKSAA